MIRKAIGLGTSLNTGRILNTEADEENNKLKIEKIVRLNVEDFPSIKT